jgi:hypothetical protein
MSSTHPKGAGHCDGKIVGHIKNNCSERVYCILRPSDDNGAGGSTELAAGADGGGEGGGLYSCGHSESSTYVFKCVTAKSHDDGCRVEW